MLSADSQPLYGSGKQGGTVLYAYTEMKTGSPKISVHVEIFWNRTAFSRAPVHSFFLAAYVLLQLIFLTCSLQTQLLLMFTVGL